MCALCESGGRGFHATASNGGGSDTAAGRSSATIVNPARPDPRSEGPRFDQGDFIDWFNGPRPHGEGGHVQVDWAGFVRGGSLADSLLADQLGQTVTVKAPALDLATNFVAGDGSETQADSGPGSGQDGIAGNTSSSEVLVIGAPAVTNYINSSGDSDFYQVTLEAGHYYEFTMNPEGSLDAVLEIRAANGTTVLGSSDGPLGPETEVLGFYAQTSGTYWINADGFTSSTGAYTLSAVEAPLPGILDSIDWGGETVANPTVILVYFAQAGEVIDGNPPSLGWNAYEIQQAMLAFGVYENIINVDFQITTDINAADFKLVTNNSNEFLGFFGPPNTGSGSGVGVFARNGTGWDEAGGGGLEVGGYGFVTLTHEFGHGMGLAHPHDNGGGSSVMLGVTSPFGSYGVNNLNQGLFTVMSYNNAWETSPNGDTPGSTLSYGYMGTLGSLDIALLQDKYGANTSYNAGDTNYALATANGAGTYYACIWDGGGSADSISYAGAASAFIDLRAATIDYTASGGGYVSYVTGVYAGFTIAQGVVIENASGGSGADTITGNSAVNTLSGNNGADTLRGGGGDDILNGGAGNDTFVFAAGDGNDTISDFTAGGSEDSLQVTGFESYTLVQEGANLRVVFDGSNSILLMNVLAANFTAADINLGGGGGGGGTPTAGDDVLTGTAGADSIDALAGNDTVSGLDGNDTLLGADGNDILNGGPGADVLNGGTGIDTVDYADALSAVSVNLAVTSAQNTQGAGTDTISAVENATGSAFNDTLTGNSAANTLNGGDGNDTLSGATGADILIGGAGTDTLNGAGGADILDGGTGDDILNGGAGNDTFLFTAGDGADTITGFAAGGSQDSIQVTGFASYTLVQEGANLRVVLDGSNSILLTNVAAANFTAADINIPLGGGGGGNVIDGTAGADSLAGTAAADTINGLAGDDTLNGAGDNDILNGGDDNDILVGGLGNDALNGGAGSDTADYAAAASAVTASLASNTATGGDGSDTFSGVENLTGSAFNDNLTGDSAANVLIGLAGIDAIGGGGGADTINGGDGDDVITGGTGNDTIDGGAGNDTFNFASGDGVDTINGFVAGGTDDTIMVTGFASYTLAQEGADLRVILDGSNSILLTNVLAANFTAADINIPLGGGGGGGSVIDGTAGNDTLNGTSGAETINGLDGNDTLRGQGGDDTLNGGAGTDTLNGGSGADILNGGAGNDTMNGGAGNDVFLFDAGLFGADRIQQFNQGGDKIQIAGIAGVDDFSDLVVTTQAGQGALITFPDGSSILLAATSAGQVDASDFIFGP